METTRDRQQPMEVASHVRAQILEQHRVLRRLLHQSSELAHDLAPAGTEVRPRLIALFRTVVNNLDIHMGFEERHLVPLIRELSVDGELRAQNLLEEHLRQRTEFDIVIDLATSMDDVPTLSLTLNTLIHDILVDMSYEEQGILSEPVLRDDPITDEQTTG